MNSDNLQVDSLDFDLIKSNLKEYLRGQDKFKDFDFEGSTMNILLDLLAYNTHYQAFYANMVANEAFLDSAAMRASAVSIGKHLGYVPKSIKSSTNIIDIDLGSNPTLIEGVQNGLVFVFRGEKFTGFTDTGISTSFTALKNFKAMYAGDRVLVKDVTINEGSIKTFSFVVNSFDTGQKFILPSTSIDVDTLVVTIQKSTKDTEGVLDSWFLCNDITSLDAASKAYFLQETEDGKFQIYFGDGIVGAALQNGNVITVEYLQTSGVNGNDCKTFSYSPNTTNTQMAYASEPVCTAKTDSFGKNIGSYGGAASETTSSIKYYAPRHYQTQERAVTKDDYKTILSKEFIDTAESVYVWGGEENTPPEYGKVFVSIKPVGAKKLSVLEKLAIEKNVLSKKNMLTIIPKIVDPEYIYIILDMTVRYNSLKAKITPSILETIMRLRIDTFAANTLQKFGRDFRLSTFLTYMDASNGMISSSSANLKLQKRIEPILGKSYPYTIKFDNALFHPIAGYPSILSSSAFGYTDLLSSAIVKPTVEAYLDDDGNGNVRLYKLVRGEKVYMSNTLGTIDYALGKVVLKNFAPIYSLPASTTEIYITVTPDADDIGARRNDILVVDQTQVNIIFSQDQTEIDNNQSGARFPF